MRPSISLYHALTFLFILALTLFPNVYAAEYSVSLDNDHFNVSWHIFAWQNLTGFCDTCPKVFPEHVNYSLNSAELAPFTSSLQTSMRQRVPSVTVSQPSVHIASNNATTKCSPICPRQWFNLTMNFQVQEDAPRTNNVARYDMSWKSVQINDSLTAGGFEFNQVGEKYLVPGYAPIINTRSVGGRTVTVTFGTVTVTNTTYHDAAKNIVLLDMSRIRIPIENWTMTRDFNAQRNIWTSPRSGGFLTFADFRISEGGTTTDFLYPAEARITAQISAPMNTFTNGDTLYLDMTNGFWEKVAFSIIAATIGLLAVTLVLERRISSTQWTRRKAKKKP